MPGRGGSCNRRHTGSGHTGCSTDSRSNRAGGLGTTVSAGRSERPQSPLRMCLWGGSALWGASQRCGTAVRSPDLRAGHAGPLDGPPAASAQRRPRRQALWPSFQSFSWQALEQYGRLHFAHFLSSRDTGLRPSGRGATTPTTTTTTTLSLVFSRCRVKPAPATPCGRCARRRQAQLWRPGGARARAAPSAARGRVRAAPERVAPGRRARGRWAGAGGRRAAHGGRPAAGSRRLRKEPSRTSCYPRLLAKGCRRQGRPPLIDESVPPTARGPPASGSRHAGLALVHSPRPHADVPAERGPKELHARVRAQPLAPDSGSALRDVTPQTELVIMAPKAPFCASCARLSVAWPVRVHYIMWQQCWTETK